MASAFGRIGDTLKTLETKLGETHKAAVTSFEETFEIRYPFVPFKPSGGSGGSHNEPYGLLIIAHTGEESRKPKLSLRHGMLASTRSGHDRRLLYRRSRETALNSKRGTKFLRATHRRMIQRHSSCGPL
jgi:hypothetical protein